MDYGTARTGIAVTDELQLIASGLSTVATAQLMQFLKDYVTKERVERIVIGEPKRMDNTPSGSEKAISAFIGQLEREIPGMAVERLDERFTSKIAFRSMIDGGLSKSKRRNKALVDEISATLILQDYLNRKI